MTGTTPGGPGDVTNTGSRLAEIMGTVQPSGMR